MRCLMIVLVAVSVALADRLPDSFKWCKLSDPDYEVCFKDAFYSALRQLENGIPEINAAALNPLVIPSASVDRGHHVLSFKNLKLYNLTKTEIVTMNLLPTPEKFEATMELFVEDVTGVCDYTLTGSLLVFTVDGDGKAVISFRNVTVETVMKAVAVKGEDYTYYQLKEFDFVIKPKSASYQMDNIIKGNEVLNEAINRALNENWEVLFEDFQPLLREIMGKFLIEYSNNIFKYIPNVYD